MTPDYNETVDLGVYTKADGTPLLTYDADSNEVNIQAASIKRNGAASGPRYEVFEIGPDTEGWQEGTPVVAAQVQIEIDATGGTWDLNVVPLDFDVSAAAVEAVLADMFTPSDPSVFSVTGTDGGPFVITWTDFLTAGGTDDPADGTATPFGIAGLVDDTNLTGGTGATVTILEEGAAAVPSGLVVPEGTDWSGTPPQPEIQRITVSPRTGTTGTFVISVGAEQTAPIDIEDPDIEDTLQAELRQFTAEGFSDIVVTRDDQGDEVDLIVTTAANLDIPGLGIDDSGLVGSAPATTSTLQQGFAGDSPHELGSFEVHQSQFLIPKLWIELAAPADDDYFINLEDDDGNPYMICVVPAGSLWGYASLTEPTGEGGEFAGYFSSLAILRDGLDAVAGSQAYNNGFGSGWDPNSPSLTKTLHAVVRTVQLGTLADVTILKARAAFLIV